jgi:hypothetical protein
MSVFTSSLAAAKVATVAVAVLLGVARPALAEPPALSVLGEVTPSPSFASGASIERLAFEDKVEFTREVMRAVPLEELAQLFGFDSRSFEWAHRSGGYLASIAPNLVVTLGIGVEEHARAASFALAWMYVYHQDAVPFFAAAPAGRPAVRIRFEQALTPAREGAMFAALIEALGKDAGYTRLGRHEIVVIDFAGRSGFADDIGAFSSRMAALNPVARVASFAAKCEFRPHDWASDPDGASLLAAITRAFPSHGLEARLRALRARYQQAVSAWLNMHAS